jgi:hypothetical protein
MTEQNGETLEFVYIPETTWESDGKQKAQKHRIVKKTAKRVYVECDPYDGTLPDQKRRTFILNRHELEARGKAEWGSGVNSWPCFATAKAALDYATRFLTFRHVERFDPDAWLAEMNARWAKINARWAEIIDPHATLGVDSSASPVEIRAAFLDKALRLHPDHGGDEKEFVKLRQAYEQAMRLAKAPEGQ